MDREEIRSRFEHRQPIPWAALEELVFQAARDALIEAGAPNAEVDRYSKGPIDIVLRLRYRPITVGPRRAPGLSTTTAYIECKHYDRPLEFADAAKVFCVAIRDQPDSLIIVSSSELAPQAWDYARHFFTIDEVRGMFAGVHFDVWRLSDILGIETEAARRVGQAASALRRWTLRAVDAFGARVLAQSTSATPIALTPGAIHTLEISPGGCDHGLTLRDTRARHVVLELTGPCRRTRPKGDRSTRCTLSPAMLSSLPSDQIFSIEIVGQCATSGHFALLLGSVSLNQSSHRADFRDVTTTFWSGRLLAQDGPRVLVLSGDGGIGKTHFARLLCRRLHEKAGYRCVALTVSPDTGPGFFFRLLWALLVPASGGTEDPPSDVSMVAASLGRLLEDDHRPEADLIASAIAQGDLSKVDIEVLTYLCARLLSATPVNRALLISNVHHLSPQLLRGLGVLLDAVADSGWGRLRVVLEHRSGEELPHLADFLTRLGERSSGVAFLTLGPISVPELSVALPDVPPDQRQDLVEAIYRKAGGNPLFVTHLLRWANDEGYMAVDDGQMRVLDWTGLRRTLAVLPPDLPRFLEHRIERLVSDRFGPDGLYAVLAAASFGNFELSTDQALALTNLSDAVAARSRQHLIAKGVLEEGFDGSITFAHELMLLSARTAVSSLPAFEPFAFDALTRLRPAVFIDMLLGGRLAEALRRSRGAINYYNAAYELARVGADYHGQCTALIGAHAIWSATQPVDEAGFRQYVEMTLALADAELQGGSMVGSEHALEEVLRAADSQSANRVSPGEARWWRRRALSGRVRLCVRWMRPAAAIEAFGELLATFEAPETGNVILRDGLTRLLLTCAMANRPMDAHRAATILLERWGDMSVDERSSLCSDIGRIHLQSSLNETRRWWALGCDLAADVRQLAHSRLNLHVLDVLTEAKTADDGEALRQRASALGIHNQVLRYDVAKSITAVRTGACDEAHHILMRALRLARGIAQPFWEWKILNNLGVIEALASRREIGLEFLGSALALTTELRSPGPSLDGIMGCIRRSNTISAPSPYLGQPPHQSGLATVLAHNVHVAGGRAGLIFPDAADPLAALAVDPPCGRLYLALE